MAGMLYTLFMDTTGSGRSLHHVVMWPSVNLLEGTVFAELINSVPVSLLRNRVSVLTLVMVGCRGTHHILVCGHRHIFMTAASETKILTVSPS